MKIYTDADGKIHVPGEGALIRPRHGIFAVCIAHAHILLTWPVCTPERAELPGGGIEDGEDPAEALRREIFEETGADFPVVKAAVEYRQDVAYAEEKPEHYLDYSQVFWKLEEAVAVAGFFGGEKHPADALKARWMPLPALRTLRFHAMHRRALEAFGIL